MQPVLDFLEVVDDQFLLASDLADLDGYFADVEPSRWNLKRGKNRRGWTRRDRIYHKNQAILASASLSDPPEIEPNDRRVETGFRVLRSLSRKRVLDACRIAVEYCESVPRLNSLASRLTEYAQTHLEWCEWVRAQDYFSDVRDRRAEFRAELAGSVKILESLTADLDGPVSPNTWRKNGICVDGKLGPLPFKLLSYIWNCTGRCAEFGNVEDAVFDEDMLDVHGRPSKLHDHQKAVNKFLELHETGWRMKSDSKRGRAGQVWMEKKPD